MWDMQEPELNSFDKMLLDSNKVKVRTLFKLVEIE